MAPSQRRKNLYVIAPCLAVIAIMLGLVAYSPTLYRLFCGATGLGGTTQRVYSDTAAVSKRTVTVQFDSNVEPGLPWRFEPKQRSVTVHLGEPMLAFFSAENTSDQPIVGHATFNVTPKVTRNVPWKVACDGHRCASLNPTACHFVRCAFCGPRFPWPPFCASWPLGDVSPGSRLAAKN